MQINIQIAPATIDWIISKTQLNEISPKVADNLLAWRSGEKTPTFNQIENASKATGIPLGYFFLQNPPIENTTLIECRTVDSIAVKDTSRDLMNTIHDMEMIQDWMREQLISDGFEPLDYIGKFKTSGYMEIAENARKILGIDIDWYKSVEVGKSFNYIRNVMNSSGVIVMVNGMVGNNTHRLLNVNEFRAFTIIDEYAPLIFINSNDSENARLFSLLHEFAHICIGENNLFNDRYSFGEKVNKAETICNSVAAEIIAPQVLFENEWNISIKNNTQKQVIYNLAAKFKCGTMVIARKALDNNFIPFKLYKEIAELAVKIYNEQRKKKGNGGGFYTNLSFKIDKRFLNMLVSSVAEGKTLYTDAYRLTNTNRNTFDKLINLGGIKK